MDIDKIIGELRAERARLDDVVLHLEKLSLARIPRKGRPASSGTDAGLKAGRGPNQSRIGARVTAAGA
jgi:hypothetical protein